MPLFVRIVSMMVISMMGLCVGLHVCAPAVAFSEPFGALAYDVTTDSFGFSFDQLTQEEANSVALAGCGQAGCRIQITFAGGCAALAYGSPDNIRAAYGPSRASAQEQALTQCNALQSGCSIKVWTCNNNLGVNFAALAYDAAKDRFGFSNQRASAAEATENALQFCGPSCLPVLTFQEGCGAYATSVDTGISGQGLAPNKEDAQNAALFQCAQRGGSACEIRTWTCN